MYLLIAKPSLFVVQSPQRADTLYVEPPADYHAEMSFIMPPANVLLEHDEMIGYIAARERIIRDNHAALIDHGKAIWPMSTRPKLILWTRIKSTQKPNKK
jgi:hypothetical protein